MISTKQVLWTLGIATGFILAMLAGSCLGDCEQSIDFAGEVGR